jgi:hypothetical protein
MPPVRISIAILRLEENRTRRQFFPGVRLANDYAKSHERTDLRSVKGARARK